MGTFSWVKKKIAWIYKPTSSSLFTHYCWRPTTECHKSRAWVSAVSWLPTKLQTTQNDIVLFKKYNLSKQRRFEEKKIRSKRHRFDSMQSCKSQLPHSDHKSRPIPIQLLSILRQHWVKPSHTTIKLHPSTIPPSLHLIAGLTERERDL